MGVCLQGGLHPGGGLPPGKRVSSSREGGLHPGRGAYIGGGGDWA